MDDNLFHEEIKENKYNCEEERKETMGPGFVMTSVDEPKNPPVNNEPEKEVFKEHYKEPKKKKTHFVRNIVVLLLCCVVGGGSIGAGYGAVKFIAGASSEKAESEAPIKSTTTSAVQVSSKEINAAISVIDSVFPSVVNISISATGNQNYYGYIIPYEYTSAGSGIIFGEDDNKVYIATNNHVVEGATSISICIEDEDGISASVVGTDASNDLAVISVLKEDLKKAGIDQIVIAEFGDSDNISVGEDVIAIGNALGEGKVATGGMISSKLKTVTIDNNAFTFIQTDSAINPGNSGGALVNYDGKVIGINTAKKSSDQIEGIGYAIPSNIALPILETLLVDGTTPKPYIGIVGMDVTNELAEKFGLPVGAYITQVLENSGADKAGLQEGDIITDFAGVKIMNMNTLIEAVSDLEVGDVVDIRVIRNGKDIVETKITIYDANNL